MKTAVIVFVRHPEAGKVKTRLAATLGEETALQVYKKLLAHTLSVAKALIADKFIFYAEEIVEEDMWSEEGFFKQQQAGGDLGHRMEQAFQTVFQKGYETVVIIGSDCYELEPEIVENGFRQLKNKDVVIGPARDGGYYLLGMKKMHPLLFAEKNWSTTTVYADTQRAITALQLTCGMLPTLNDVDEEKDVPLAWLEKS